jgi:hypothetical protein
VEPTDAASLEKQERERLTRNLTLTEMRRQMTGDAQAAALVAIGGKHPREGLKPGVDEEIELAAKPAFLSF